MLHKKYFVAIVNFPFTICNVGRNYSYINFVKDILRVSHYLGFDTIRFINMFSHIHPLSYVFLERGTNSLNIVLQCDNRIQVHTRHHGNMIHRIYFNPL